MTHQEKQTYARRYAQQIQNGATWQDWQTRAEADGLYPRDVAVLQPEILHLIGEPYAADFQRGIDLNQTPENPGLEPSVYEAILARQRETVRTRLITEMAGKLKAEELDKSQLVEYYNYSFLTEEEYATAIYRSVDQRKAPRKVDQRGYLITGVLFLFISCLFILMGMIGIPLIATSIISAGALYQYSFAKQVDDAIRPKKPE